MTKTHFLMLLIQKLIGAKIHFATLDQNKMPVVRKKKSLEGFLNFSSLEFLRAFGVKSLDLLPSGTVRHAVDVMRRIYEGKDSHSTIVEKAEALIKRLHPIHVALLGCEALEASRKALETSRKAAREALEKRFSILSGGKALPDGTATPQLTGLVSDLRDDLVAKTQRLMNEVNEPALKHPDVGRASDERLVELKLWLDARYKELHCVRPRPYRLFAQEFAEQLAAVQ